MSVAAALLYTIRHHQSSERERGKKKKKKGEKEKGEKKKERVPWVLEQSKESLIIYDSDRQILIWT